MLTSWIFHTVWNRHPGGSLARVVIVTTVILTTIILATIILATITLTTIILTTIILTITIPGRQRGVRTRQGWLVNPGALTPPEGRHPS